MSIDHLGSLTLMLLLALPTRIQLLCSSSCLGGFRRFVDSWLAAFLLKVLFDLVQEDGNGRSLIKLAGP